MHAVCATARQGPGNGEGKGHRPNVHGSELPRSSWCYLYQAKLPMPTWVRSAATVPDLAEEHAPLVLDRLDDRLPRLQLLRQVQSRNVHVAAGESGKQKKTAEASP